MEKIGKLKLLIFISLFIPLLTAYWQLFTGHFLFADDAFMWEMAGNCRTHPQFYYFLSVGRVFFPLLACPLWSFVQTVHDLNIGRFINVSVLSLSAFLFCNWLRRHSINAVHSVLLTATIFVLPTFQTQVSLVNSFPHTVGLLTAVSAGLAANRGAQGITGTWKSIFSRYTFFTLALLFFSMAIYTPLATFYFAMIALPLILSTTGEKFGGRRQLYLFGVFLVTAFTYLVFSRFTFTVVPALAEMQTDNWHRVVMVKDIRWKIPVFFKSLYAALNLWKMPPTNQFALVIAAILLSGAAVGVVDLLKRKEFFRGLLILSLFPLAMLPNLVAESSLISYRMISALSALVAVSLFLAVRKLCFTFLGKVGDLIVGLVFSFFAVAGVLKAQSNLRDFIIIPTNAELTYIGKILQENNLNEIQRIDVVQPSPGNFLSASRPLATVDDEYGLLTSTLPQLVPGLVRSVLKEFGLKAHEIEKIKIFPVASLGSPALKPDGYENEKSTIMIDMQKVYDELYSKMMHSS